MASPPAISQKWQSSRALLLVHGIGNARPGDYDPLVAQLRHILDEQGPQTAIYFFYYDQFNQWFADKAQAAQGCTKLLQSIRGRLDATALGTTIANFIGDVIWPILIADARSAVRTALLRQLQQIVLDGIAAGHQPDAQHLSIIAHSMGCFHTYEALHVAANDVTQRLAPGTNGVQFDNVIFMASPVQLIRTAAQDIGIAVPRRDQLFCVSAPALAMPSETTVLGPIASARRTVAIAGDLDPVGGYMFHKREAWAYMALPTQQTFIDAEQSCNISTEAQLAAVLQQSLRDKTAPQITPENPHDWGAYVSRHASDLKTWLGSTA